MIVQNTFPISIKFKHFFYFLTFFEIAGLCCLLIIRYFLPSSFAFLSYLDEVLLLLIIFILFIINRYLSSNGIKNNKMWFWVIISLIFLNLLWRKTALLYPDLNIYQFHTITNLLVLSFGLILLPQTQNKLRAIASLLFQEKSTIYKNKNLTPHHDFSRLYPNLIHVPILGKMSFWLYNEDLKFIFFFILASLVLKIYQIFTGPINTDDGYVLYDLYLVSKGFIPFIDFQTKGILFNYIFSPVINIPFFGHWLYTYRFLTLFLSLFNLYIIYKICLLLKQRIFYFFVLFYYFLPIFLHSWYGIIHPALIMSICLTLSIYFILSASKKSSRNLFHIGLGLLFLFIGGLSRQSSFFYFATTMIFLIYTIFKNKNKFHLFKNKLPNIKTIYISLLLFLVLLILGITTFNLVNVGNYLSIITNIFTLNKNIIGSYSGWDISFIKEFTFGWIILSFPLYILILKYCYHLKNFVTRTFSFIYLSSFAVIAIIINVIFNYSTKGSYSGTNQYLDFFFHQLGYIFLLYIFIRGIEFVFKIKIPEIVINFIISAFGILIIIFNYNTISQLVSSNYRYIIPFTLGVIIIYIIIINLRSLKYFLKITIFEKYLLSIVLSFFIFYTYIYSSLTIPFLGEISIVLVFVACCFIVSIIEYIGTNNVRSFGIIITIFLFFYPSYIHTYSSFRANSDIIPISYYNETVHWLKDHYFENEIFSNYPIYAFGLGINSTFHLSRPQTYDLYPEPNYIREGYNFPSEEEIITYLKNNPNIWFIGEPTGNKYLRKYLKNLDKYLTDDYERIKDVGNGFLTIYRQK